MGFAASAHYRIVVMGGGTAGVAISNRFKNLVPKGQMAIIEPNKISGQSIFLCIYIVI